MVHVALVDIHHGGGDVKLAAFRHGITRVYREVQDNLFEQSSVGRDAGQIGRVTKLIGDILAQCSVQQAAEVGDDLVEIESFQLQHISFAEGQELAGEFSSAF